MVEILIPKWAYVFYKVLALQRASAVLTMWGEDPQVDGYIGNAFVAASDTICLILDLLTYHVKVCEFLAFGVHELGIF